ncbi:hypothetical protein A0H81_03703 [Grifola frondosa]|uniref:Uncharacterized protein n=1 Tax=Grifola frondosa TaxID=5627 RepID=A0A1C7MID7_GRIFR|nr:hypothetical protein A0H81_03703 [Grifola frondosa]
MGAAPAMTTAPVAVTLGQESGRKSGLPPGVNSWKSQEEPGFSEPGSRRDEETLYYPANASPLNIFNIVAAAPRTCDAATAYNIEPSTQIRPNGDGEIVRVEGQPSP